ncbi:MAG: monovalent cation/H+ antiporter subunit D [Thiohalocapsa sp.]
MSALSDHLVIAPLLVPLLAGILLVLMRGSATPLRRNLSMLGVQILFAVSLTLLLNVLNGQLLVYQLGDWSAPFGIVLVADRLSAMMVSLTSILAVLVMLHAIHGSDRKGRQFHVLFQFQLFGINGAFLTGDLFNLFVFFEVLLIASYGLLLHGGGAGRSRAGLHYVVINLVGSALFLFGIGTLYGMLGTLNMADLSLRMAALPAEDRELVRAGALLLMLVFALKAALAPLHLWLPGAYANAGPAAAALFAIMTKVGAYSILRIYTLVLAPGVEGLAELVPTLLLALGLTTIVLGTIGVLASRGMSMMVAYLVVVSAGTLLSAFGIGGAAAMTAGLYYMLHSTLIAAALFLLTDNIADTRGRFRDRLQAGPLLPATNLLGGLFLLLAVAAAGLPPLSGFVGKVLILQAGLENAWMPWIFAVVLITSLLNLTALVRAGSTLFFKSDPNTGAAKLPEISFLVPVVLFAVLIIALVVYAGPVYDFAQATAEQLAEPGVYIEAVLGETAGTQRP